MNHIIDRNNVEKYAGLKLIEKKIERTNKIQPLFINISGTVILERKNSILTSIT